MRLRSLSRSFRKSLGAYLWQFGRKRQPEIDRLERELQARRRAHRPTRSVMTEMRAKRVEQLKRDLAHV